MANRTRNNAIQLYLSDEELEHLNNRLKMLGVQNRSNYMRKMILDGYCIQLDLPELRKAVSLLGRCSNNLNQYARMANATGSFYAKDIQELRERLDEIWQLTRSLLEEVSKVQ